MAKQDEVKVVFNPRLWSYKQYNQFVQAFSAGDEQAAFDLALKIIVSWDYPVDLNGEDPLGELKMGEGFRILKSLTTLLGDYFDKEQAEDAVTVDLHWNMRRYFAFQEARQKRDYSKVEAMMREVCTIQGAEEGKPLNAVQGALAMMALSEAAKKVMEGKG